MLTLLALFIGHLLWEVLKEDFLHVDAPTVESEMVAKSGFVAVFGLLRVIPWCPIEGYILIYLVFFGVNFLLDYWVWKLTNKL